MVDERLRSLQRRFQASGDAADEQAYLRELGRVRPGALELAARFGSASAARALGQEPAAEGPSLLREGFGQGSRDQLDGSWEATLVYLRAGVEGVLATWRALWRRPGLPMRAEHADTLQELEALLDLVAGWFEGGRTEEASRSVVPWVYANPARAELIDGRFSHAQARALWHLTLSVGCLLYACAPLWAPMRSGKPQGRPVREDGTPIPEATVRLERASMAGFELFEAINGLVYSGHLPLGTPAPAEGLGDNAFGAALERVEALAAARLVAWLLRPAAA